MVGCGHHLFKSIRKDFISSHVANDEWLIRINSYEPNRRGKPVCTTLQPGHRLQSYKREQANCRVASDLSVIFFPCWNSHGYGASENIRNLQIRDRLDPSALRSCSSLLLPPRCRSSGFREGKRSNLSSQGYRSELDLLDLSSRYWYDVDLRLGLDPRESYSK